MKIEHIMIGAAVAFVLYERRRSAAIDSSLSQAREQSASMRVNPPSATLGVDSRVPVPSRSATPATVAPGKTVTASKAVSLVRGVIGAPRQNEPATSVVGGFGRGTGSRAPNTVGEGGGRPYNPIGDDGFNGI